jgi:hypothetical protein
MSWRNRNAAPTRPNWPLSTLAIKLQGNLFLFLCLEFASIAEAAAAASKVKCDFLQR